MANDVSEMLAMIDAEIPHGVPVPTLDDYAIALESLEQRERLALPKRRIVAAVMPQPEVAGIKKCADCGYYAKEKCVTPHQPGYYDKAGSDSFSYASTIRQFHCHGEWWVPRSIASDPLATVFK